MLYILNYLIENKYIDEADTLFFKYCIEVTVFNFFFSECAGTAGSTLHLLLDIGWIEDGGSALDANSLLHLCTLLHLHLQPINQVVFLVSYYLTVWDILS